MLANKAPKWDPSRKVYVLNFKGRVDKASVKNFILEEKELGDNSR